MATKENINWKRINKGDTLPCQSFLRKKNGEILKSSTIGGVKVEQDCYYLPVDEVINVIKDYPVEESEDERIRKELLAVIDDLILPDEQKERFIAWLEKQGEKKPILDVEIPFGTDSELVEEVITIPDGCYAIIEDNKVILRKGEKKSSWSRKDESMLNFVKVVLNKHKNDEFFDEFKTTFNDCLTWFRNIKSRVGCEMNCITTKEWSKEDEREVDVLKAYICSREWSDSHIDRALGIVDELVKKLKFLRPQSSWKPSKEQFELLDSICASNYLTTTNTRVLQKLYDALKKLK